MPARARTHAVLFDLDGTLADTLPGLLAAMNSALSRHGRPATTAAALRPLVSGGTAGMVRAALGDGAPAAAHEAIAKDFLDDYERDPSRGISLFDGVPELLHALRARGIACGIVTNKRSRFTATVVSALCLDPAPASVVSGDTAARPKPAADPLLLACQQLGVAANSAVYLGDARNDVRSAHAAGMPCLVAGWGYLPGADETVDWQADGHLDSPLGLLAWLDADPRAHRNR